jgi:Predicted xylanase/chitin deacetylase
MPNLKEKIFPFIANRIGIERFTNVSEPLIAHPFYHTVSNETRRHISLLYQPKTTKEFEKELDFILSFFQPISITEFYEHTKKEKFLTRHSFHLSFDDGLRDVYETALPILKRKGIPATLFVGSSFVDNKELFFRHKTALLIEKLDMGKISLSAQKEAGKYWKKTNNDSLRSLILQIKYKDKHLLDDIAGIFEVDFTDFLQKNKPYLMTEELKSMQKQGFAIGSHSIDHPLFSELDKKERSRQLTESINFVKANLGEKYSFFAFPFSDENIEDDFFNELYQYANLSFGIAGMGIHRNNRHIDRIDMEKYGKTAEEAFNKAILKHRFHKFFKKS